MHRFDAYIKSIIDGLGINVEQKNELSDEFRDHLEMIKLEYIEGGLNEEQAEEKSIERFGSSRELSKKISKSFNEFRKANTVIFGIAIILCWLLLYRIGSNIPVPAYSDNIPIYYYFLIIFGHSLNLMPVGYFTPIIFRKANKVSAILKISAVVSLLLGILYSFFIVYSFSIYSTKLIALFISVVLIGTPGGFLLGFLVLKLINRRNHKKMIIE